MSTNGTAPTQRIVRIAYFYDSPVFAAENRICAPSVATVIDYLSSALSCLGIRTEIVSASETRNTRGSYPARTTQISDSVTLSACPTWGFENPMLRAGAKVISRLWLVRYLCKNVQNGETVIFCSTPVLFEPLLIFRLLTKRRGIKLLLFAGEVFQYVQPLPQLKRKLEWLLLEDADSYICSTPMLEKVINKSHRPSAILSGTYEIEPDFGERFNDGKTHIVYSGVINSSKGASTAVDVARALGTNFALHILGWGLDADIVALRNQIADVNINGQGCQAFYEGVKRGRDYKVFLQCCAIGLCPQDLKASYNTTSFPSKIFSYLSNGLRVVSVNIPAIRTSQVGDILYYADSDQPIDIARTIESIDLDTSYDSRAVLDEMNRNFIHRLGEML